MTHTATFTDWPSAHAWLQRLAAWAKGNTLQGQAVTIIAKQARRTVPQNDLMWAVLTEFSRQKTWTVNGVECKLDKEDWKDLLTAAYRKDLRIAPSIDGRGVVMLGSRTSDFNKEAMAGFIEFLYSTANDIGVVCE
jgi:hypothetical protein